MKSDLIASQQLSPKEFPNRIVFQLDDFFDTLHYCVWTSSVSAEGATGTIHEFRKALHQCKIVHPDDLSACDQVMQTQADISRVSTMNIRLFDVIQRIDLEPVALRAYRQLVKDSYTELQDGSVTVTNVLTRLLRLSQLTGGFLGSDEDPKPEQVSTTKLDALEEILESADGQKLVIIARFIPEIHAIEQMLARKGIRYALIYGGVTERATQVTSFQTDPTVQVFIGQIATAGLGITLTTASTMVFYSLDYSMSNYEQTKARIHRVGQRHPCTYIHLVARGTVDEQVLKALKDKADLAKTLVDDCRAGRNPFDPYTRMYAAGNDV